jgi:putative nucleotidyltransferase with HDIG domain
VYLGFNTIKNLALSIAAIGILPADNAAGFDGGKYLLHSLATANIAKQLALRVNGADPMDCFIAGLLHDFGKVVFAQFMPQEFRKALETSQWNETSLHLALRELIGADHAVVGAMLVEKWRFPADLIETIRCQYGPEVKDTPMIACVFAANQISKKLEFGFAGNPWVEELPPALVKRLGGTLDEIIVSLGDLAPMVEEARIFSKI